MRRTSFEDMACPLARTADLLGDSWSVLILREVFYGHHRFDEFVTELGIPSNTLTRRLSELVDHGLLEKQRYSDKPPRHEYVLTPKGRDLRPVMLALLTWGNRHLPLKGKPVRLIDTETGQSVELKLIDGRTGRAIGPQHKVERRIGQPKRVELFDFDGVTGKADAAGD